LCYQNSDSPELTCAFGIKSSSFKVHVFTILISCKKTKNVWTFGTCERVCFRLFQPFFSAENRRTPAFGGG